MFRDPLNDVLSTTSTNCSALPISQCMLDTVQVSSESCNADCSHSSRNTFSSSSVSSVELIKPAVAPKFATRASSSIIDQQNEVELHSTFSHFTNHGEFAIKQTNVVDTSIFCPYLPALRDRFGPHILRSHMNQTNYKPIPKNERVDLTGFIAKDPQAWSMEDVLAWILDVAKRNNIAFEDLEVHRFTDCSGLSLITMSEEDFKQRDPNYGKLLSVELHKLLLVPNEVEDWSSKECKPVLHEFSKSEVNYSNSNTSCGQNSFDDLQEENIIASSLTSINSASTYSEHEQSACKMPSSSSLKTNLKVNKDGRPRKRSQHTKGNKLWEFIRDALRNPSTCPSILRWEDPVEGVFRIVESEKLAKLWGEKKNNQKMTYEKLSRAMRTYYDKKILVPVPKTGLYPKKLVYKFGPGAYGWERMKAKTENDNK